MNTNVGLNKVPSSNKMCIDMNEIRLKKIKNKIYEIKYAIDLIDKNRDDVDWNLISQYQVLSEEFINQNRDKVNWHLISQYQILSEDFINQNSDEVYWFYVVMNQVLSEDFIVQNRDKVNWHLISQYQVLSEEFINQNSDNVYWSSISSYQQLSENFIEHHSDKVDWYCISKYQKLSETFIERHKDKFNLSIINKYQKLSKEFTEKHEVVFWPLKNSWMYMDKEYKRKEIEKTGLYEIIGDYVYAYKSVRQNNYSIYNFQYYYEIGKVYTAHANHNIDEENSFGLSAWTYPGAKSYYNYGRILKVKVHLDDVACLVYKGNKLRCTKIEIIEEV